MRVLALAGTILLGLGLVVGAAGDDIITVDGDDSDWFPADPNTWRSEHNDPIGDAVAPTDPPTYLYGYDIDWSYGLWDNEASRVAFMLQTVDPTPHSGDQSADFVEILINVDDDEATGGSWHEMDGADYRIWWNYDGTAGTTYDLGSANHPVYWQEWVGGPNSWSTVGGTDAGDVLMAWDDQGTDYSVIECTANPELFGTPDEFTWGFYLDNGTTASDDASPNDMNQRGYTPEPTTLALLPLGLLGLAAWRRRSNTS